MRMIQCRSCGKRYNYDKDDFCPKCGAYNPIRGSAAQPRQAPPKAVRPATPPAGQPRPRIPQQPLPQRQVQRPTTQQSGPRRVQYHTPEAGPQTRRRREEDEGRRRGPAVVALIVSLVVLIGAGTILYNVMGGIGTGTKEPEPTSLPEPVAGEFQHDPWEEFSLNGVTVSVEDAWWVDLAPDFRYAKEGFRCLAVDVWITGGEKQTGLVIDTPRIELAGGGQIPLDDDPFLARELSKYYNIYAVSLRDYQWEDPLFGSFVFFVPEGETEFTLLIDEYAPGDPEGSDPRAFHSVSLSPGDWP